MINCYQDVMDTNLVIPLGPGRCKIVYDFYFVPCTGEEAERFRTQSMTVADQIQAEDTGICEEVQRGLQSRAYHTGRYCVKREGGGLHFHRLLSRALQKAL
jgi:choline monooxygenase